MRTLATSLIVLACAACSTTPGLDMTVTPTSIAGDGASPVTIALKLNRSGSPADGTVHVTISDGSIKDSNDPHAIDIDTSSGAANVVVLPPRKGRGTIDVTGSASLDGVALKKTASVTLTPSGGLASSLSFTCSKQNIGALVSGRTDPIHVLCTAIATDANNKPILNASIETMAEAGTLDWVTDSTGKQNLIYTVLPGAPPPVDVDPFDTTGKPNSCSSGCQADVTSAGCAEPCWIDSGKTRNPRDGVATLVVAVPGVAAFDDKGEPFVDTDDSGARENGEAYIDYNGNGKYDAPDGSKHERMLWQAVRMVWSGDLDVTATAHGSKFSSSVTGTHATVTLRLNDRNFNTLAADGLAGSDAVSLSSPQCTPTSAGGTAGTLTIPASLQLRQDTPGIRFNANGDIDGPQFQSTYRVGSDYTFNASIDQAGNQCALQGQISRVYDPGAPGFDSAGDLSTEQVNGAITF